MRKFLFLAAAFMAGLTVSAQQQKSAEVVKVNAQKYDFGKIKQNVPTTTYFTITNLSDKPVFIENAWAGCGCTTPEYSKAPFGANGTTKLKVGYNAAVMGRFEKDVNIKIAGVDQPLLVKITGEVLDASAYDAYTKTEEFKKAEKARLASEAKENKDVKKTKEHSSSK